MALLLREPFVFMTPVLYNSISDRILWESYFAPRTKSGRLITLARRERKAKKEAKGPTGNPRLAGRELPTVEELGVPQEVLMVGIPMDFILMTYQVWRGRGLSPAETTEKFWQVTGRKPR